MEVQEVEEEVDSLSAVPIIAGKSIRALLDTGYLVGDCISKRVVDKLNASDLLFNVSTTIYSGFNNQCKNNFQAFKINLSFINEITSSSEHIITTVIVLKDSPIDLIIGRETVKKLRLIDSLPSHLSSLQI
jgi:predicted aspartyl protease